MDAAQYGDILLQIRLRNMNLLLQILQGYFTAIGGYLIGFDYPASRKTADKG